MATILDGKKVSEELLKEVKETVDICSTKPKIAVILVGNNISSQIYVKRKQKIAKSIGIESVLINLKKDTSEEDLLKEIDALNADNSTHAILVQMPLPKHIDEYKVLERISYLKDVDGFSSYNSACIMSGKRPLVYPCTPKGIITLLDRYNIKIESQHAVIIGRSNIVGRPLASMLLNRDATVTVCHSKTKNMGKIIHAADIIISAVGSPKLITAGMVKEGATVIDVGINRLDSGSIVGDVDYDEVKNVAGYITPVPGGIGPMTIASLMENAVELYKFSFLTK